MVKERRKRTRVPVGFDLNILIQDKSIEVKTRNLSLTGVSFTSAHTFEPGKRCVVNLKLNADVQLNIEGKILRSENRETIVAFMEMDEDSFYHLKKILQYNAADSDKIEEELGQPAFTGLPE